MSYHCPHCDCKTGVIKTTAEVRTRRCPACGLEFLTEEIELEIPHIDKRTTRYAKPANRRAINQSHS